MGNGHCRWILARGWRAEKLNDLGQKNDYAPWNREIYVKYTTFAET